MRSKTYKIVEGDGCSARGEDVKDKMENALIRKNDTISGHESFAFTARIARQNHNTIRYHVCMILPLSHNPSPSWTGDHISPNGGAHDAIARLTENINMDNRGDAHGKRTKSEP